MSSGSAAPANQDSLIAELSSLTGLAPAEAEQYLAAANGDLQIAASLFFEGSRLSAPYSEGDDDSASDNDMAGDDQQQNPNPNVPQGGGRTLDGSYVPGPASSSSGQPAQGRQAPAQRGLRTLGDLQGRSGGHGHGHDHDDDDEEDDQENQDFFAGGEKSGLAVQNPNQANPRDQINSILRRARQGVPRPGGDSAEPASRFTGTGMTLGGDDAPSRAIPDPSADVPQPAPRAHRELHLWRDGFSVDDGPLYRYDDPTNARTLEMINTGHAPLHILNVEHGQEVDVEVHPHKDEDYKRPKQKYVAFGGSGQRLGSPTPGASSTPPPPAAATSTTTASAPVSTGSAAATVAVDSSVPTINLQIRLGDGTRLQSQFNTTHTIGDVYNFVNASSTASLQREYALMTTFPSKELNDKSQVLGDLAEFKRGGVVVQKWK
ncbi:SEP-domain-containing protein [Aaosphaeria arxii CBS 175.79]|uniref:SEP-domain-containing protein n=1 Tax=Aaosphaeria arxii CBS 175.79 TaxID=1450172 RepID=A0A6A5Y7N8_9PLEO|nr:SEP-domain-containing protein [Aaosphaeria arxii CBS 175.79]KAF2021243.1 SEP-domain-containing protein [Aaosphaeria arxii CBS 175.79]